MNKWIICQKGNLHNLSQIERIINVISSTHVQNKNVVR
jgi:hypothetical protein